MLLYNFSPDNPLNSTVQYMTVTTRATGYAIFVSNQDNRKAIWKSSKNIQDLIYIYKIPNKNLLSVL